MAGPGRATEPVADPARALRRPHALLGWRGNSSVLGVTIHPGLGSEPPRRPGPLKGSSEMTARLRDCMPLLDRLCYLGWRLDPPDNAYQRPLAPGHKGPNTAVAGDRYCNRTRGICPEMSIDPPEWSAPWRPDSVRRGPCWTCGANIGCTCLLWLARYPKVRVEAFEPHPTYAGASATQPRAERLGRPGKTPRGGGGDGRGG